MAKRTSSRATSAAVAKPAATTPVVADTTALDPLAGAQGGSASAADQTPPTLTGELLPPEGGPSTGTEPPASADAPLSSEAPAPQSEGLANDQPPAAPETPPAGDGTPPAPAPETPKPDDQEQEQEQDKDQDQDQDQDDETDKDDDEPAETLQAELANHTPTRQVLRPLALVLEPAESKTVTFRDAEHETKCREHIAALARLNGWGEGEGLHWSTQE